MERTDQLRRQLYGEAKPLVMSWLDRMVESLGRQGESERLRGEREL